jgi:hypothetical protein
MRLITLKIERGPTVFDRIKKAASQTSLRLAVRKRSIEGASMVTVTVLEEHEVYPANLMAIGEVGQVPDEVYLIRTFANPWLVWCLKKREKYFPHDNQPEPDWKVDPKTLKPLVS